jgi:hypothetical protein
MCALTWFVIKNFIQLGDTESYLTDVYNEREFSSTLVMRFIGVYLSSLITDFGLNLLTCQFLSVLIIKTLQRYQLSKKLFILTVVILSTPSFTIWTCVYSKESIVCIAFLLFFYSLAPYLNYKKNRIQRVIILAFSGLILAIFKLQYLPFCITYIYFLIVKKYIKPTAAFILFIIFVFLVVGAFYQASDTLDSYASSLYAHFNIDNSSTRDQVFFLTEGDYFRQSIQGIYLSWVQFKFDEVSNSIFAFIFWIESLILMIVILGIFLYGVRRLLYKKLNPYYAFICIIGIVLLLMAYYPFGVFNAGSANRYKQSIYIPIFLTLLLLLAKPRSKDSIK